MGDVINLDNADSTDAIEVGMFTVDTRLSCLDLAVKYGAQFSLTKSDVIRCAASFEEYVMNGDAPK